MTHFNTRAARIILIMRSRKTYITEDFGPRIRALRRERGWTQNEFADMVNCSHRALAYYEKDGKYPPVPVVVEMSRVLEISIEAILGMDELEKKQEINEPNLLRDKEDRRLWKKVRQLKSMSERDKNAVLRLINTISENKGISA